MVGADTDDSVAGSEATAIKEEQVERENGSFRGKATRACHTSVKALVTSSASRDPKVEDGVESV